MQETKEKEANTETIALIYCRVSSKAQELDGDGLGPEVRYMERIRVALAQYTEQKTKLAEGDE